MSPNPDNSNITQIGKLQYFDASLSKEGSHIIKGYPVSDFKYPEA